MATLSPAIMQDLLGYTANSESMTVHYPPSLAEALEAIPVYLRKLRATSLGRLAPVWESDVRFVLDRLEEMDVPDAAQPVAGAIDHGSRGYMGMSYGGYIAAMLAQGDRRAKAAINLDGGYWTAELIDADVRTPFLMLNSDPTPVMAAMLPEMSVYRGEYGPGAPTAGDLAYERLATAGLRDDVHRIMIPGIQHVGISDLPELIGVPEVAAALGEPGITGEAHRHPERPGAGVSGPLREGSQLRLPRRRAGQVSGSHGARPWRIPATGGGAGGWEGPAAAEPPSPGLSRTPMN